MIERGQVPIKVGTYQNTRHILLLFQDIITHKFPMTDVVKGLEMVNNSANSIKVVLFPNPEDTNK